MHKSHTAQMNKTQNTYGYNSEEIWVKHSTYEQNSRHISKTEQMNKTQSTYGYNSEEIWVKHRANMGNTQHIWEKYTAHMIKIHRSYK